MDGRKLGRGIGDQRTDLPVVSCLPAGREPAAPWGLAALAPDAPKAHRISAGYRRRCAVLRAGLDTPAGRPHSAGWYSTWLQL